MKKSKRGGTRKGAGRKTIADKKIPVTVWFKKSTVKMYNGIEKFKKVLYDFIIEE